MQGCVELSSVASRFGAIGGALSTGCDRLIHPSVVDEAVRAGQARLIASLLCGPFALGISAWALVPAENGLAFTLALVCASFGLAWTGVLVIAMSGRTALVGRLALAAATIAVAAIVVVGGGLGSPVASLLLALPVEAMLVSRRRSAGFWGAGCAAAAVLLTSLLPLQAGQAVAWHWLLPVGYAATVWLRMSDWARQETQAVETPRWPELEQAIDGALLRFSANGDLIDASESVQQALGVEPHLLLGQGLFERVHLTDRIGYMTALSELRDTAGRRRVELRLRTLVADMAGNVETYGDFALELSKSDATSQIVGILGGIEEKVALRRKVAEAKEANERLDQAKGRFLATVSHELRTPLNSIIGFSDMLMHEMFGSFRDPRQKEYVDIIRQSGNHLLAVVNSILDVSKIEAGTYSTSFEPFPLREVIDSCSSMLSVQADAKSIKLMTAIASEVGEVRADKRAIQQILINLVSNAVKFTPEGGSVTIGARRFGGRIHLWVSDTGIGIAEHDLDRLGEPFAQVQNAYNRQFEGTGLGLSLVKGLVTLHEGTMSIESALGEGTTVTVTLPIDGPKDLTGGDQGGDVVPITRLRSKEDGYGPLRKAG
jgi:cell cycle sensor histidine kinase DivJ